MRRAPTARVAVLACTAAALLALGLKAEFITETTPVPPVGAPGGPSRPLSPADLARWKRGRALFDRDWHLADGVGRPDMNGDSCRACHQDPAIGGAGGLDLNVSRFGLDNGGQGPFMNLPGGQIASRLRRPDMPGREEFDPTTADVFEQRQTPTLFGSGLIDGIPESEILANADPMDLNGDGIAGVARMIDVGGGVLRVGRFGWKAGLPSLADFLKDAAGEEIGLTVADVSTGFGIQSDNDGVPDPELSGRDFDDLLFFLQNLAAPQRKGSTNPLVTRGEQVFTQIGCDACHVPALAGAAGAVPLYSDLLLHRVWPQTFRGMAEPDAPAGVYRTPPLWGLRDTAPYLHDGRAVTLRDAVLFHQGEAFPARQAFEALSSSDQTALLLFLEDL